MTEGWRKDDKGCFCFERLDEDLVDKLNAVGCVYPATSEEVKAAVKEPYCIGLQSRVRTAGYL